MNFLISLITGVFIGAAAGYLGSLMVTKRMSLVGDALGHVALPGMGLALVFGIDVSWGAFIFLLIGIFLIWILESRTILPAETLAGVVFIFSLAIGFLITPELELLHALTGDISRISFAGASVSVLASVGLIILIHRIYPRIMIAFVAEDLAVANNIKIKKYNFIYLLAIALVVALGVKIVGSLLVGALLIVPPAVSKNISKNMAQYSIGAAVIGSLSALLGIFLAQSANLPVGPMIILVSVAFFVLSLFFNKDRVGDFFSHNDIKL